MNKKILWVDDEVEYLKPHVLFLQGKGYDVATSNNGFDALDMIKNEHYDLAILDEMMPGITGLDTLMQIKEIRPTLPVVMVTKSEEEDIMNRAIGVNISDYLIKPINPNQVMMSIKKILHKQELYDETTTMDYRKEFSSISDSFTSADSILDWINIYKKLINWDLQLSDSLDKSVREILEFQKNEANSEFTKYIKKNYLNWFKPECEDKPLMSHNLFKSSVLPVIDESTKTTFLLIDNLRYDQWLVIRPLLASYFTLEKEEFYCSILPTATQYARNAIFAGLTPLSIDSIMPDQWLNDNEDGAKNKYEEDFLRRQLQSLGKDYSVFFEKLIRPETGRKLLDNISRLDDYKLSVIVYNFLDILSHARTDTGIIRELADDEVAFRSLTRSWFEHSELFGMMKELSRMKHTVIITSDHGTIHVENPTKVVGDKETSPNLRYKTGKSLKYNPKDVFVMSNPELAGLPKSNVNSSFIFACNRDFLVYPNNFNHYVRYYKDTFQHGGISMEEMLVPFVVLEPK